jgi:microsomal dipeptidase-like Zn-dependent dipeptidase
MFGEAHRGKRTWSDRSFSGRRIDKQPRRGYAAALTASAASPGASTYEQVDHVEGLENLSEFPNVLRWLVGHGYTDEQITKLVGGNALAALVRVWV